MPERRSIYLSSFSHANPIPVGSVIGNVLYSGALTGRDPVSGAMPDSLDEQCANVFRYAKELLHEAGGTTDNIAKMTFHLVDYRDRAALNREWQQMFPNPASMPARQVFAASLDGGSLVHADLVAVLS